MSPELLIFLIRLANALIWSAVVVRAFRGPRPVSDLARGLVLLLLFGGMWVLAFGGLVVLGLVPGDVARFVYTAFTAFAALIGLAFFIDGWAEDDETPPEPK